MELIFQRARGVLKAIQRHGPLKYTRRLLHKMLGGLYKEQVSTVFRRELASDIELIDAKVELEVRPYQEEDRSLLLDFLTQYVRQDQIEETISRGMIPMLGFVDNKLIALSWFTINPLYLDSLELTLDYGDSTGYIEGSRTDDSMKGKGIAPAIRTSICKYLHDNGLQQVFVAAGDDNPASQAVARKCKFQPYESIVFRRFLWFRHYTRKRL